MSNQIISILRRTPGQQIPRPHTRASSFGEGQELLGRTCQIDWRNLNTDEPIADHNGAQFFAFTEE